MRFGLSQGPAALCTCSCNAAMLATGHPGGILCAFKPCKPIFDSWGFLAASPNRMRNLYYCRQAAAGRRLMPSRSWPRAECMPTAQRRFVGQDIVDCAGRALQKPSFSWNMSEVMRHHKSNLAKAFFPSPNWETLSAGCGPSLPGVSVTVSHAWPSLAARTRKSHSKCLFGRWPNIPSWTSWPS